MHVSALTTEEGPERIFTSTGIPNAWLMREDLPTPVYRYALSEGMLALTGSELLTLPTTKTRNLHLIQAELRQEIGKDRSARRTVDMPSKCRRLQVVDIQLTS